MFCRVLDDVLPRTYLFSVVNLVVSKFLVIFAVKIGVFNMSQDKHSLRAVYTNNKSLNEYDK